MEFIAKGAVVVALIFQLSADIDPYRGFKTKGGGDCCGGTDCAPLADTRVKAVPGGYEVAGVGFVPNADAQPGPDFRYHACFLNGQIRCFLTPGLGI